MAQVNFHIIKVWGDRPEESDPAPRATNGEGEGDGGDNNGGSSGGGGSSGVESNGGDNNGFARNCIDAVRGIRPSSLESESESLHALQLLCWCCAWALTVRARVLVQQHSSRELAGTILMAVISIAAASLVRTIVNALIRSVHPASACLAAVLSHSRKALCLRGRMRNPSLEGPELQMRHTHAPGVSVQANGAR